MVGDAHAPGDRQALAGLGVDEHQLVGDLAGAGGLRQRANESHGESSGARDGQDATRGLILRCIAVLHTILLLRLVRGLWGWRVQSLQRSPSAANPLCTDCRSPDDATPVSVIEVERQNSGAR